MQGGGEEEGGDGEVVERIGERYGKVVGNFGRSRLLGFEDAKEAIVQLIIDAEGQGQGNRKRLFNPDFKVMGCFSSQDDEKPRTACIYYAEGFEEKSGEGGEAKEAVDDKEAQQRELAPEGGEVQQQLDRFMGEEVVFEMPDGV